MDSIARITEQLPSWSSWPAQMTGHLYHGRVRYELCVLYYLFSPSCTKIVPCRLSYHKRLPQLYALILHTLIPSHTRMLLPIGLLFDSSVESKSFNKRAACRAKENMRTWSQGLISSLRFLSFTSYDRNISYSACSYFRSNHTLYEELVGTTPILPLGSIPTRSICLFPKYLKFTW